MLSQKAGERRRGKGRGRGGEREEERRVLIAGTGSDIKGLEDCVLDIYSDFMRKKIGGQNYSLLGNFFLSKLFLWRLEGSPPRLRA